ncbi:MAG: thioredoxin [Mycoplasmoidaceae bacterium]|nr:MAG: thioredoxin [Mycoplasmoidaceae bacterium]
MTIKEFDKLIQSNKVVVLDFFASWCGPCQMLSPIIDELKKEMKTIVFLKSNIDEDLELASKFKITSIPTIMLFKNGKLVNSFKGFKPKEFIKTWITK